MKANEQEIFEVQKYEQSVMEAMERESAHLRAK